MAIKVPRALRGRSATEWFLFILVLVVLGVYLAHSAREHYGETEVQEQERLTMHVVAIERMLLRQIAATDAAISSVVEDLPLWKTEHDGYARANRRLQVLSATLDGIRNIFVTDKYGRVVASNKSDSIGRDFSDRSFFRTAAQGNNPKTLYVSPPYSTRSAGYVMSFNRVITGPLGEFEGVVVAGVDPEYFATLLDSVRYAQEVQASIIHGDGIFFMSAPPRADLSGVNFTDSGTLFGRYRQGGMAQQVFSGTASVSGEQRMVAFRTIQTAALHMDKPLVVSVSRDLNSIYARWRRELLTDGTLYGLLTLASVFSLLVYQRRREAFDALKQNHEIARQKAEDDLRAHARTLEILSASMLQHREDEKARLALDLHEGVAQTLSAIKVNLEAVASQFVKGGTEPAKALEPALRTVRQAIADVRDMATSLRPSSLDDLGFLATLRALLKDFRDQHPYMQMHTEIALSDTDVPRRLGIILYRVIEEVGQSLAAYGAVRNFDLNLSLKDACIVLSLQYDGLANAADGPGQEDWGTTRELVVLSGGKLVLGETDNGALSLVVSWPTGGT